jgi:hypothetical protein
MATLARGDDLGLREDLTNTVNRRALLITRHGDELGWVPDLLLGYVHQVRDVGGMTIRVAQVNSPDVPPNLRLRVQLSGRVPYGYSPFRGEAWATSGDCTT